MKKFKDQLSELPDVSHLKKITLLDSTGAECGHILNKAGTQGSLKLYNHLFIVFAELNVNAAAEGLQLYCEHVSDAKDNPGKHPNIDCLLDILETKKSLKMVIT
tara:strand:+ start:1174 stop:1485 length:312 start_codon:yes stop_codon:yes gene_type:complete